MRGAGTRSLPRAVVANGKFLSRHYGVSNHEGRELKTIAFGDGL